MDTTRRLWLGLAVLLAASFAVLLWMGREMHQQLPPMPSRVVTSSGFVVYTRADMEPGRQVWQSIGGQQLGSIWGHGALVAPDWTADWLHREAEFMGQPLIEVLVWMRVPGDTIFSVGALLFAWFVAQQWIRPARVREPRPSAA